VVIAAFAGAAAVGCFAMYWPSDIARIEPLIFVGQIVLGIGLVCWIILARAAAVRSRRWSELAVLAWLVLGLRGCSADQMILGENHRAISAPDARREVVMVDGRAVECWVAHSPAKGPPRATVL